MGVGDGQRVNIPAPALVKRIRDVVRERARRLKVAGAQADSEASAEEDPANASPRKAYACFHGRPYRKPTQVGG